MGTFLVVSAMFCTKAKAKAVPILPGIPGFKRIGL
jgi:hypothetical protein